MREREDSEMGRTSVHVSVIGALHLPFHLIPAGLTGRYTVILQVDRISPRRPCAEDEVSILTSRNCSLLVWSDVTCIIAILALNRSAKSGVYVSGILIGDARAIDRKVTEMRVRQ